MAILHSVLFKARPTATTEQTAAMMAAIAAFKDQLPDLIQSMYSGVDSSPQTKGFSYSFTMIFKNRADIDTYLASKEHRQFEKKMRHILMDAIVVDYEIPDTKL
ncbi:hypothetical protein BGZ51_008340 [Haplosporangium sp. Z 767]|nr:hypothetical protein BGZ51_008340 [Haplosporangium sp. Z 767]